MEKLISYIQLYSSENFNPPMFSKQRTFDGSTYISFLKLLFQSHYSF